MATHLEIPLVQKIVKEVEAAGLKVELVEEEYVWCNPGDYSLSSRACGWFDPDDKRCALQVAVGKPPNEWLDILAHEYCHFLQWKEGLTFDEYNEAMDDLENWTDHKRKLTEARRWECACIIQDIEYDAEKRTAELMRQYPDYFDEDTVIEYIKGANAYLTSYSVVVLTGRWPDPPAYKVQEIRDQMPDHFSDNYSYSKAGVIYLDLFKQHCYKEKKS